MNTSGSNNYLIIGGSSGIGQRTMELLLESGHKVFATAHTTESHELYDGAHFTYYNANDDASSITLPEKLDGLVYAPGSIDLKPFHRIDPDHFVEDYTVNVLGFVKVLQHALPSLKKADNPSVVVYSTVAIQKGFPFHSKIAASKGALEALCRSLAAEYAPKIRFNAIAPSLTDTPLSAGLLNSETKRDANAKRNPMKRIGTVDDIAGMTHFLLSDKSSYISGQTISVDGGASTLNIQ